MFHFVLGLRFSQSSWISRTLRAGLSARDFFLLWFGAPRLGHDAALKGQSVLLLLVPELVAVLDKGRFVVFPPCVIFHAFFFPLDFVIPSLSIDKKFFPASRHS